MIAPTRQVDAGGQDDQRSAPRRRCRRSAPAAGSASARRARRSSIPSSSPKTTIDATSTISGTSAGCHVQRVLEPADEAALRCPRTRRPSRSRFDCGLVVVGFGACSTSASPPCACAVGRAARPGCRGATAARLRIATVTRRCWRSTPAELHALLRPRSTSTPSTGLSVTSATPVSKKSLPSVGCRLGAVLGVGGDRLDAQRRHQQRILLRGGADHAVRDVLHARAAAVDRHDQHVVLAADGLERLVGTGRGRFVDRVDDVDLGIDWPAGFPSPCGRLPRCRRSRRGRRCAGRPRRPTCSGSPRSMPKPCRKPWSRSTPTVGWLTARSSMRDLGIRGLVAQLWPRPTGRSVRRPGSCRWRRSRRRRRSGSSGVSSAITSMPASRACCTDGHDRRGVGGGQQDALGAVGDAGLDRRDLGFVVAVDLAGEGSSARCRVLRPWPSAPSFILTKNGLVSVLVIRQAVAPVSAGKSGAGHGGQSKRGAGKKSCH